MSEEIMNGQELCKINETQQTPRASLMAQQVKNLPAMQETQETQVQSLGQEDTLEQEIATHSSILTWKIAETEEPGGLQAHKESDMTEDACIGHRHATDKSLQLCPTLCNPVPGILQARTLDWVAISFSNA